jgi:hypothetical protein
MKYKSSTRVHLGVHIHAHLTTALTDGRRHPDPSGRRDSLTFVTAMHHPGLAGQDGSCGKPAVGVFWKRRESMEIPIQLLYESNSFDFPSIKSAEALPGYPHYNLLSSTVYVSSEVRPLRAPLLPNVRFPVMCSFDKKKYCVS